MIVPTGIGCEIGGHCGDGNAPARLLGACCETLVLHPNVVNASDINEMPDNALYVEGSHLDQFLQGKLFLQKVRSNKVLVVVNKADYQSINAVSAARITLGSGRGDPGTEGAAATDCPHGKRHRHGDVMNWEELVEQVRDLEFDALGIATPITISNEALATYWRDGGVNPVGGVEALATRLIGEALDKPCAHGPVDYALTGFKEVVDPRIAVEIITENFIHCLLKGLHKAPRISRESGGGMSYREIDCMVSPYGCFGAPHQACLDAGIPVIVVRENKSCLNHPEHPKFIYVENYIEAAGMIMAMKAGVHPASVRRPLAYTTVRKA